MAADTGRPLEALRADGGASANDALMQLEADLLDLPVERPVVAETTALGAACLAGLAVGFWRDTAELEANWALDRRFEPSMASDERTRMRERGPARSIGSEVGRGTTDLGIRD
jgi:glycerol kinase